MPVLINVDFNAEAFGAVERKLGGDSAQRVINAAAKLASIEAESLVALGFRSSTDPYGEPWAPLKHRDGKPLIDTGRLRASFHGRPTDDGFSIGTNVKYAAVHQTGGHVKGGRTVIAARGRDWRFVSAGVFDSKGNQSRFNAKGRLAAGKKKHVFTTRHISGAADIPARPMLPDAKRGWGPKWNERIRKSVLLAFKQVLGVKL